MHSNGSAAPRWTSWDLQASARWSLTAGSVVGLSMKFHLGFGYHFNSMTSSSDELNIAFQTIFRGALKPTIMTMLQSFVPPLRFIVSCRAPTIPYRGLNAKNFRLYQPVITCFIRTENATRQKVRGCEDRHETDWRAAGPRAQACTF